MLSPGKMKLHPKKKGEHPIVIPTISKITKDVAGESGISAIEIGIGIDHSKKRNNSQLFHLARENLDVRVQLMILQIKVISRTRK